MMEEGDLYEDVFQKLCPKMSEIGYDSFILIPIFKTKASNCINIAMLNLNLKHIS
jgi:hypothetical protein